jgi:formate dehydrogenase major subunit
MTLHLNGRPVEPCGSLLATCRAAGVELPALCHRDGVAGSGGHCRSCLVEVDGRPAAACTTPARDGTVVETESAALAAYRRDLGELMAAEATPAPDSAAARQLAAWGVDGHRYPRPPLEHHPIPRRDGSHPYLRLDLAACIGCRLCEATCAAVQGRFVYAFTGRGATSALTWGDGAFDTSACVACGACAAACPSGAISDVDRQRALAGPTPVPPVRTTCAYCGVGCQLEVHVAADRVARIEGADAAPNHGHLCVKGRYAHGFVRHPDRLRTPLVRRGGALVPCSWEEAIAAVADGFRRAISAGGPGAVGALSSSRCTNEENYLVQKWMRGGVGTNNVDCCARVCHGPSARGMRQSLGTGAATSSFADIEAADLFLIAGANPSEAHPIVGARVLQAVLRGARLVVIDPRRTELAGLADVHLQLRPGSNVALLNSLAYVLVDEGLVDRAFIDTRTEGFDDYHRFLLDSAPERTAAVTGLEPALVRRAARLYGEAARPMQLHGLGITEHYQGSESVMLLCNLALLTGAIGREGAGVNPLRGQNNVQGAADMGCQPDSVTGYGDPFDATVRARFAAVWGRPLPEAQGLNLPQMYAAARDGALRALFILGEDVVQTDPSAHVDEGLAALDLLVVQELFLTETARRAHVVLPAASYLEKDGTFTSGERRVQRVRRALPPLPGARPDWEVLCDLMAATGWPQPFRHPSEIMDEIARVAPILAGVSYPRLEAGGLQWPVPAADHPGTPILHRDSFPRGRASFAAVAYVPSPSLANTDAADYPLRLTTGRVLEHYNCGSMTRRSDNLLLHPADELELHAADATHLGLADGDRVVIASPWGEAHAVARVSPRIAAGSAFLSFHFAETGTNRLISPVLDRLADCPEYKVTPVTVRRA